MRQCWLPRVVAPVYFWNGSDNNSDDDSDNNSDNDVRANRTVAYSAGETSLPNVRWKKGGAQCPDKWLAPRKHKYMVQLKDTVNIYWKLHFRREGYVGVNLNFMG